MSRLIIPVKEADLDKKNTTFSFSIPHMTNSKTCMVKFIIFSLVLVCIPYNQWLIILRGAKQYLPLSHDKERSWLRRKDFPDLYGPMTCVGQIKGRY
jgi:hypothetical protein